jgi:hypothetical protein
VSTRDRPEEASSPELPASIGRPANAALVDAGITTLEQLAERTEREVLALHGVGPKAVRILAAELAGRNLSFAPPRRG